MNALNEIQGYVLNDLRVFREQYLPGKEEFLHRGHNPKRGGAFEEKRYRVQSLDRFDGFIFAGNAGGEMPSDYAKSVHYHNIILQHERVLGTAHGFDVEPVLDEHRRPLENQINFERFMDAVMKNSDQFLLLHITDPYKMAAYNFAVKNGIAVSGSAKISGVVNPFLFDSQGMAYGDNVDGYALMEAISGKKIVKGANILMIGAGGVAGSIALEAIDRSIKKLVILNRTEQRAHDLGEKLRKERNLGTDDVITGGIDAIEKYSPEADIIISAITHNPYVTEEIARNVPDSTLFVDVNYGHSALLAQAGLQTGHDSIDGTPMVYYGVERVAQMAFERKLHRKVSAHTLNALKKTAGL